MGLKEVYFGMEDKYYAVLDWLDRHGLPVYKVVDSIEAQNIPSFPIAVFSLVLVLGILSFFVLPGIFPSGAALTISVQDETQSPLAGVSVRLTGDGLTGDALSSRLTDLDGKVSFTNLPIGETITVIATQEGYTIDAKTVVLDEGENEKTIIALGTNVEKTIQLQLYVSNSTESYNNPLSLSFACSNDSSFTKNTTVNNGTVTIDVPGNCGTLTAQSNDPTISFEQNVIDLESSLPSLYVITQPAGNAVLRVRVIEESGLEISGVTIQLKNKFGDQLAQKFTDATGFVEFSGLVPDTYTIFIPSDGTHAELDSGSFEVDDVAPVEKTFTLQKASVGEVRVQLVDEGSLAPVSGAKVTLFKGNQSIATKTTNEGGQVTFSVSSSNSLTISVDHPSYLIKTGYLIAVSTAGYTQVPMTKATPQNSQIVTVHVIDELGQPVENAYVALKKSPSGASIGTNKITGVSGTVVFTSLEEGTYFASAYKPGFSDQLKSDLFTVKARENVEVTVKLVLGTGSVLLSVLGADGQPLAGATVQPVDGITHDNISGDFTTGVDGKAEVTLRADKYAYFVVTEPNHMPFVTMPVPLKKGITQNMEVTLVKDIQKLEIKPLGTFVNGTPVLEESGLAPGQMYTIRFGLFVPKNSVFVETGAHIRTGSSQEGQSNPIENDDWFIRSVRGAFAKSLKGTTYTPPTGLGEDSQHVTSGDSKWVNVVFTPAHEGVTLIEVDVQVKDTVGQGADLPLFYRAWGKTGSYVRFPVDAVLGSSESVAEKQGLYANANLKLFSTGAGTTLCSKDLCLALVGEDLANGLQTPVTSEYEADVSTKHKLLFTFTSISDNVFADTTLNIQSTSSAAALGLYDVTNAVGAKKTGTITGNKIEIPIGVIQKNNVVFGFANIDTVKEGTGKVTLSLVSNKKVLFTRDILVKVNAAGQMSAELLPKAILPLLVNQMLVHVTQAGLDDLPLENASVTIQLNGTLLTSGYTDPDGTFAFELHEPNVGDALTIIIEKPGYKPITLLQNVGSDIVQFIPSQINETLVINGVSNKTRDIHVINLASIPLTVQEIALSSGFNDWVKFELINDEVIGETLGLNGDLNVSFTLGLTEKGQNLLTPQSLKGSLLVKLVSQSGKTYVNSLPINLKIGFGGEVDVEDCLLITPGQWDIISSPNQQNQLTFEIKNTCTVKGAPVKLVNLSAKIRQTTGDPIGKFTVISDEKQVALSPTIDNLVSGMVTASFQGATPSSLEPTNLSGGYKTILQNVPANGNVAVTVIFDPAQVVSGFANPQLVFQATNLTNTGIADTLTQTVNMNIVLNKLKECVQIKTPSLLEIDACPTNVGHGLYGNYYNQMYQGTGTPYYNPSYGVLNKTSNPSGSSLLPSSVSGFGVAQNTQYYSPAYGTTGYDGLGNYNPNAGAYNGLNGYANTYTPLANQYYNNTSLMGGLGAQGGLYGGFGGQYGCSFTQLTVVNACKSEVEISLDIDPNLQANAGGFSLKPNEAQIVRVGSGYRIGKYAVGVNAHTKGSTDAAKQIAIVSVLVKSPTEVNADCITLDKTKYRFNDFVQKPVKGKVYNKCYDVGVRLVPNSDTVTLASYFSADGALATDGENGAQPRANSMAHDLQLIGVETQGDGGDTIQVLEFQIFPDLSLFQKNPALLDGTGGLGERFLDYKLFAEVNYYRIESYGTISVKYLDPYGGAQQKPFPVIFENLFRAAEGLDELLQGGSTKITKFQECINLDALQNLTFDDSDFQGGTTITYTTKDPGSILVTGREACGESDRIGEITSPSVMKGSENQNVQATFRRVGNHDVEVTIVRPLNVQSDVTLNGRLDTTVTRVFTNPGTQNVTIPVSIKVLKPGKVSSITALQPLACGDNYFKGEGFTSQYGFDKIKWDWTWNGSPDCSNYFCDGAQLMIYASKKVEALNTFVKNNKGLFSTVKQTDAFTSENFIANILQTATIPVWKKPSSTSSVPASIEFYIGNDGRILRDPDTAAQGHVEMVFDPKKDLPANMSDAASVLSYLQTFENDMESLANQYPDDYANTVILFPTSELQKRKAYGELTTPVDVQYQLDIVKATQSAPATPIKVTPSGTLLDWLTKVNGNSISLGSNSYYVLTLPEFRQIHLSILGLQLLNPEAKNIQFSFDNGTTWVLMTPETLRELYQSIDSVYVGMEAVTDPVAKKELLNDEEMRVYLLENAKKDIQWAPFEDAQDFENDVFNNPVYLIGQTFSSTMAANFAKEDGAPYFYTAQLNGMGVEPAAIEKTTFMKENSTTLTSVEPGLYNLQLIGSWGGNNPTIPMDKGIKSLELRITNKGAKTLDLLGKDYPKNPFFKIPFNGSIGTAPFEVNPKSEIVSGPGGGVVTLKKTLAELSQLSKENNNKAVLFSFKNNSIISAPNMPIGLKMTYGGAIATPGMQYYITSQSTGQPLPISEQTIVWYDCTKALSSPINPTSNPFCTSDAAARTVAEAAPGQYYYAGHVLVPPASISGSSYAVTPICAVEEGTMQGLAGSLNVNATPANASIPLDSTGAGDLAKDPPITLEELKAAIENNAACAKISPTEFTVIWDLANPSVIPQLLTCQSNGPVLPTIPTP